MSKMLSNQVLYSNQASYIYIEGNPVLIKACRTNEEYEAAVKAAIRANTFVKED